MQHPNHESEAVVSITRSKSNIDQSSTATPLLDTDKPAHVPDAWPTSPRRVKSSLVSVILDIIFDIILFAWSAVFLAFALVVNHYDQAPTVDHPKATRMLENATKYVRTIRDFRVYKNQSHA
jgi:hypothetical protein